MIYETDLKDTITISTKYISGQLFIKNIALKILANRIKSNTVNIAGINNC